MHKRSQAAMEFLMTYGWAILVVTVAIGALAYFGILSPEQYMPELCSIPTSSGLFCNQFTSSSTGNTMTIRIHNILPESVDVLSITADDPNCTLSSCTVDPILPDSVSDCTLGCDDIASKSKIKATIRLTYKVGDSELQRVATGRIVTIAP